MDRWKTDLWVAFLGTKKKDTQGKIGKSFGVLLTNTSFVCFWIKSHLQWYNLSTTTHLALLGDSFGEPKTADWRCIQPGKVMTRFYRTLDHKVRICGTNVLWFRWNSKAITLKTKISSLTEPSNVFCRAKLINITVALNSTRYLRNEMEFLPWEVATLNMRYLHKMFDRTEVYGPMQVWLFI